MTSTLTEVWWSACVGCALWGAIITAVCLLLSAGVVKAWRRERRKG